MPRARCINCLRARRRKQMVLVQVCVISDDDEPGQQAWEHARSIPICTECLANPVVAMTLAKELREAVIR